MKTIIIQEPFNLKVVKYELDFATLNPPMQKSKEKYKEIKVTKINHKRKKPIIPSPPLIQISKKRTVNELVEELLDELYAKERDWSSNSTNEYSHGSIRAASPTSSQSIYGDHTDAVERNYLEELGYLELREQVTEYTNRMQVTGERLARFLRAKDRLRRQQKRLCAAFTVLLRHISIKDKIIRNVYENIICS